MSGLLDGILNLNPVWIAVVGGLLVFAEDAFFLGFVIPGETAAVLTGVAAGLGHLPLAVVLVVVTVAAIVGDSVGYEVGRRWFGPAMASSRRLAPYRHRIVGAQDFLGRRGGIAVFLGRFTAFFRAMMPALAGASDMPYRRFLLWNVIGGVVWATTFVLLGYLTGTSYHHVEKLVGRGFAVAVAVVAVSLVVAWRVRAERRGKQESPETP